MTEMNVETHTEYIFGAPGEAFVPRSRSGIPRGNQRRDHELDRFAGHRSVWLLERDHVGTNRDLRLREHDQVQRIGVVPNVDQRELTPLRRAMLRFEVCP